jgi:hypothetical protein
LLSKAIDACAAYKDYKGSDLSMEVQSMGRAIAVSADGRYLAVGAPDPQQEGTNQVLLYLRSLDGRSWGNRTSIEESTYMEFGGRMVWGRPENDGGPTPLYVAAPRWQPEMLAEPVGMIRSYQCTSNGGGITCTPKEELDLEGLVGQLQFFGNRFDVSPDGNVMFVSYRGRSSNGNANLLENGVAIYSRSGGAWCLTGRIESERRSNLFASDMQVAWQEGVATLVFGAPGSGGNIKGGAFVTEVELAMGVDECVNQLADAPLTVAEELDVEDDTLALVGSGVAISPGGETIAVSVPTFLVQGKTQGGFIVFRKDAATGDWSRQYDVRGSAPLSYFRSGGDAGPASMGQRMAFFNEHYLVAAGEYDASENELNTDCVFRTNDRLEIHRLKETEAELMWSKNTPTGSFSKYGSTLVPFVDERFKEVRLLSGTEARSQRFERPMPEANCAFVPDGGTGGFTDELMVLAEDFDLF